MQLLIHLLLGLCLSLALSPFFFLKPVWLLVWFISLGLLLISAQGCYAKLRAPARSLAFTERGWNLVDDRGECELDVAGEALVWKWLIVLRYREKAGGHCFNLVLLHDSAAAEELRRLRVWLRTQF